MCSMVQRGKSDAAAWASIVLSPDVDRGSALLIARHSAAKCTFAARTCGFAEHVSEGLVDAAGHFVSPVRHV